MKNYDEKTLQYLTLLEAEMGTMLTAREESSRVLEAMRYSLLGGGKRVRGVLTLASCELVSGSYAAAATAAAAMEMVHCYSLIHDDLPAMDDDDLRRGKPSCHIAFGEATAILAGDALLTLAFRTLAEIPDSKSALACIRILADSAGYRGMILGQELDLAAEGKALTPAQLTKIHSYKTGALISASMRMGAELGGATEAQVNAIHEFSSLIGHVFQLVDDILDQTANPEEFGKPVGSDAEQGKVTGASLLGIERTAQLAAEMTANAIAVLTANFKNADYLVEFARKLLARKR